MRILLKIGGAQLEQSGPRTQLCSAILSAKRAGHELIVVHGGGNQIRAVSSQLGLEDRYHDGLRITDEATADAVLMVLGGKVNRTLVAAMQRCGVAAVGISGADGGSFLASRLERPGVDLGYVGAVAGTSGKLVETLLAADFVPVVATVAPGADGVDGPFYNLNADHAAGPLCRAYRCDALVFLTDVPGVLGASGRVLPELSPAGCDELRNAGVAKGGMLPKLEAATAALQSNPEARIVIAPAAIDDCVRKALLPDGGTRFVPNPREQSHG